MSDFEKANVYGHEIDLFNLDPGEHATDVVILTRTVYHDEDGDLQDSLKCVTSTNTTGIIRVGMLKMGAKFESDAWKDKE
ncbi:hypothetical protein ACT3UQ_08815 [Glutamicibacter sp. AOP12-B1-11]|uniref:hypothetical protein n=1 Tax=Glutamicibacter sp. AOP12-B1-11 TaxID=3457725 RepID=UPI004033F230